MTVLETAQDGLGRSFTVTIPAAELEAKVEDRLRELGRTAKMPGFRPGKVPVGMLRQRYGASVLGEAVEDSVKAARDRVLAERSLRVALEPRIELKDYAPGGDLTFTMDMETLPEVAAPDLAAIKLDRPRADVDDDAVQKALERLQEARATFQDYEDDHAAALGDVVMIDFDGTVNGAPREGMKGEDRPLLLGSGSFVGTFEEQLVGTKKGDAPSVAVTFPADYAVTELQGVEAVFKVNVNAVKQRFLPDLDDGFASTWNQETLDGLRAQLKEQLERDYTRQSRQKVKRALLDHLAETHDFPVPQGMVELEFQQIWAQVEAEKQAGRMSAEEAAKPEDELKAEYRDIAERRVRLGLLLSEIGGKAQVTVSNQEIAQAAVNEARQYPGQERRVFEQIMERQDLRDRLRAPIFEEKVVDYVLERATVTDQTVPVEELFAEDET